ncbi:hypothetical protein JYT79_00555 [Cardiobacterium sp. AH-315-I02]|nr:hypothetical protein [Cardiobacterium sp. AH-315-I02]
MVVMSLSAVQLNAQQKQFSWQGELGYDFLSNQFESGADITEHTGLLRLDAAGFLYQPWFARVNGGIGLFFRQTETGEVDSTANDVSGNVMLRLLPESRFPLELFAEKTDSRTDTDLVGLQIDRTRYGFNQRYTSSGGASFNFGYERTEQTNANASANTGIEKEEIREDHTDLLKAGFSKAFGAHSIIFDANVNRVDRVGSADLTKTTFSTLRHSYRPSAEFSAEDMLTYNQNDITTDRSRFTSDFYQLNSFAFWRPRSSKNLRINGAIRALTRVTQNQQSEVDAHTASGTLGATYEWSPRWLFSANLGVSGVETDTEESSTSNFQDIRAVYTSKNYKPMGFDASWFSAINLRNNQDDISVQEAGAEIGYNLDRHFLAKEGRRLSFRGSQSLNFTEDSVEFSSQRLLTSVSLNWNQRSASSTGMAMASFSDSRTYGTGPGGNSIESEFQIINLHASIDNKLSNRSAIMGNITLQATRNFRPGIAGIIDEGNGEVKPTTTLDITYYKMALFQVPRLSFYSTLRFVRESFVPVVGNVVDENGRDNKLWENRLEYSIGRLQFSAISRISEVRNKEQSYFLFQVRRMLGGY